MRSYTEVCRMVKQAGQLSPSEKTRLRNAMGSATDYNPLSWMQRRRVPPQPGFIESIGNRIMRGFRAITPFRRRNSIRDLIGASAQPPRLRDSIRARIIGANAQPIAQIMARARDSVEQIQRNSKQTLQAAGKMDLKKALDDYYTRTGKKKPLIY